MEKLTAASPSWFHWQRDLTPGSRIYFGNPSELAEELWYYVIGIGKYRSREKQSWQRWMEQPGCVLHWLRRGQYWHRLEGRLFRIGPGDACLLDLSKTFTQGTETPVELWWLHLSGKDLPRIFLELAADRDPVFADLSRRRVESLFRQLWLLTARKPPAYEARSHGVIALLLAELFAARSQQADLVAVIGRRAVLSEKVRMAVDFIARAYPDNFGVKHIANVVGISEDYLTRKFRQEVGLAPIHYLNRFRIEQAKRLLAGSDKSVEQIGRLVGIPNPCYFAHLFRDLTGEAPLKYRQKHKRSIRNEKLKQQMWSRPRGGILEGASGRE